MKRWSYQSSKSTWPPGFDRLHAIFESKGIHSYELASIWDEIAGSQPTPKTSQDSDHCDIMLSPPTTPTTAKLGSVVRGTQSSPSVSLRHALASNPAAVAIAAKVGVSPTEIARYLPYWAENRQKRAPVPLSVLDAAGIETSTGDQELDALLGGGLQSRALTELVGPSKAGKSTLILQMAFASLAGCADPNCVAVILDSERGVQAARALQLHANKFPEISLDRLLVLSARSALSLEELVFEGLEKRLDMRYGGTKVVFLAVDSIAVLQQGPETPVSERVVLDGVVGELRRLAWQYETPVVIANQVRAAPPLLLGEDDYNDAMLVANQERWCTGWSEDRYVRERVDNASSQSSFEYVSQTIRPALGFDWTASIDTRIALKTDQNGNRTVQLVFSSSAPPNELQLRIDDHGVHGVL